MILLILAIIVVIIGIILIKKSNWNNDFDIYGIICFVIGGIPLFALMMLLAFKPLNYKNLKIEYNTIKETITNKDDIRDATFTMKIVEINEEIKRCREFKDSKWIGIFQNKKICKMKLLKKEVE